MDHQQQLEPWRQKIRDIDTQILALLSERMQIAQKIGEYKQENNLPVKDFRVEKLIIEKSRDQARALGLYPALAEDLMSTIIKYSVLKQDELQRAKVTIPSGLGQKALILGGAGQMGQWFAQFYESLGFAIHIADPKQVPQNPYPYDPDWENHIARYELIVIASPMTACADLLRKLIELKAPGLILEICSLKSPVIESLYEAVASGLRVASLHPMFGPDAEILAGKNFIFCTGNGLLSEELCQMHYQQTTAQLLILPLEDHDRIMSYVLGSSHLVNLMYAGVLADSGESLSNLRKFGGTTFLQQTQVSSKVVTENQDLYFDIQALNDESPMLLQEFQTLLEAYRSAIENKDRASFKLLMSRAQDYVREGV